jgi:hypothetical protein
MKRSPGEKEARADIWQLKAAGRRRTDRRHPEYPVDKKKSRV